MNIRTLIALVAFLALASPLAAQTANPCDTNATGPFIVTSARSFLIQWCTVSTRVEGGSIVPERIDGFYLTLDTGPKTDIAMATPLGLSTITNRYAWQYAIPSGVTRGTHTAAIVAWNYVLDFAGNPTAQRVESAAAVVPFSAVDPVSDQPPLMPSGARIVR
jgi:hypothetical protein